MPMISGTANTPMTVADIAELPDDQREALKRLNNDMQLSRAELMRRVVKEYLARHQPQAAEQAFGPWKDRPKDAIGTQQQLRSEWGG